MKVYKHERRWHFHLQFEQLLPFAVYETMTQALVKAFVEIAHVDWTIHVENPVCDEAPIRAYLANGFAKK